MVLKKLIMTITISIKKEKKCFYWHNQEENRPRNQRRDQLMIWSYDNKKLLPFYCDYNQLSQL